MPTLVVYLINAYQPVQGDPVQVEVSGDEQVSVLLERVSIMLGRPLVDMGTTAQTPAVQNLRRPRLYLNGTIMELDRTFQDYNVVGEGTGNVLCDCRPCFPLLSPCHCAKVGVHSQTRKDIVQLTTVPGQRPPYKYQFVRTLRAAIYGKVKSCVKLHLQQDGTYAAHNPPERYACKIMLKQRMSFYNQNATIKSEDPLMELATQQFLGTCTGMPHPNVAGLVECCEDRQHIFAIMKFCNGGELYDFVGQCRANTHAGKPVACIPEKAARGIYRQIVVGLAHMHSCFVVHSDLTLENVMIEQGNPVGAKIIDFGTFFYLFFFLSSPFYFLF